MSYGSEKKAFLTDAIETFHRAGPKTASGRPVRVEAIAEGSAESMESILEGQSDVHVWSPASSLLVDVLNQRWLEAHPNLGTAEKLVNDAPPLLLSPVVVAMWEPMAKALGWPEKKLGWKEIADLAVTEGGWALLGKPQWGAFKLGHTHPRYSNSGLLALVAATYAGAGKSRDLTDADVAKAAPFVKRMQGSIVHYGRSTGFFSEKMRSRGPGYLSAAVLYENLVAESYLDGKGSEQTFPIVAIYPREGTFWADHPYAVLNLPSVTLEIREGAELFKKHLLAPERQQLALARYGFRPADPAVPLAAPIDAAHGLDPKQPENLLPSPPVAVTRRILDAFEDVKRPVAITFVLDTSGSMKGDPLAQAKAGARVFLETLSPGDSVRLQFFSGRVRWLSESYEGLGSARPKAIAAVEEVFAEGGTALYQAVLDAAKPAPNAPKDAIRAVVVLTDGKDTDSRVKLDDLLAALRKGSGSGEETEGGTRVFTIGYGSGADPAVLKLIAEAGGGAFLAGTPKNIKNVYAELASFF